MCDLCNGVSPEVVALRTRSNIERFGYTMVGVEASSPWMYTIGLVEHFDHPELVVTGMAQGFAHRVIEALADAVCEGERFEAPGVVDEFGGEPLLAGIVDEGQWIHGRFDAWFGHYLRFGPQPKPSAVQIVLPGHTEQCQPLLDRDPRQNVNASNRAERRAAARRRPLR